MGRWLIASAWPYINYIPHLGTMIGSVLSADVIARYLRMKGEEVLFVSGSDEHGTPIEVEAVKRGIDPKMLTDENHIKVKNLFKEWGISFDNYTRTENEVHKNFVREFYMEIYNRGYIFTQEMTLPYCLHCRRFLPDRFVIGTCPYCNYPDARGDQCDKCGRLLEPSLLKNPRCAICGSKPVWRKSKHWFFDLPKLTDRLKDYILNNPNLPENARNTSLRMLEEGLKPRSLTRDNKWGIPAPFPGAEGKTIYVWMEAVLGYISATIEYFLNKGDPEGWKKYWLEPSTRSVFFIAKDNIPFHTIIFPALLIASGRGYVLPWRVDSVEYLIFEGQKFSKSRRIGVWIDEALKVLPADYWRFVLISIRPETKDSNFTWDIFISTINSILNDTIGNFIHRTLKLIERNFDSKIPPQYSLNEKDKRLLENLKNIFSEVTQLMDSFKLREALNKIVEIARLGNKYLNEEAPWELVRKDKTRAATVLHIAVRLVKALCILLAPFIPFSTDRLWNILGYPDSVHQHKWYEAVEDIPEGQSIIKPEPLFRKVSKEDLMNLIRRREKTTVDIKTFEKLDIRVGKILHVEKVPKSNKLLKLIIDLGGFSKQAIAGIGKHYHPEELIGKKVVVLTNIKPKVINGILSEVMVLAACDKDNISLLTIDREIPEGSKVR